MTRFSTNEIAHRFIQKKAESFFRDMLVMELESYCQPNSTAYPEYNSKYTPPYVTHDIAILKRKLPDMPYEPTCVIELKFSNVDWIIRNRHDNVHDNSSLQDNIFRENGYKNKKNLGNEGGIRNDIERMVSTQIHNAHIDISIHHILALTNPEKEIDTMYL